jgi:hypothetical protein
MTELFPITVTATTATTVTAWWEPRYTQN